MTAVENDILEDLDFQPECDAKAVDCPNPAEWSLTKKCCGDQQFLCTLHMTIFKNFIEINEMVDCTRCGTGPLTIDDFLIVPV